MLHFVHTLAGGLIIVSVCKTCIKSKTRKIKNRKQREREKSSERDMICRRVCILYMYDLPSYIIAQQSIITRR
jgi:hypothetical protein